MKRRLTIMIALTVLFTTSVHAITEGEPGDTLKNWKAGGVISLNAGQTSFTNWASGGQQSVSLNGLINLNFNYKKDKSAWDNTFDFGYGRMITGKGSDALNVKTDDKINISSKYGYQASKAWYYSAMFSFKTQFDKGYNYPNDSVKISDFMAPAYMLFALGMDYKPNDNLTVLITPLTMKSTIVNSPILSQAGAFGVEPGKKIRSEFGAYLNAQYKKDDLIKNVNFLTKIDLFSNYLKNPQNIDVNWETLFVLKVNKFISATVSTNLIYDDDIKIFSEKSKNTCARVQFKEIIGVGFTYKFNN